MRNVARRVTIVVVSIVFHAIGDAPATALPSALEHCRATQQMPPDRPELFTGGRSRLPA